MSTNPKEENWQNKNILKRIEGSLIINTKKGVTFKSGNIEIDAGKIARSIDLKKRYTQSPHRKIWAIRFKFWFRELIVI